MERLKNIDTSKPKQSSLNQNSLTQDQEIQKGLIDIVHSMKSFFTKMQDKFESIETKLKSINPPSLRPFEAILKEQIPEEPKDQITIIELVRPKNMPKDDSFDMDIETTSLLPKVRKGGALLRFTDDSEKLIKIKRRNSQSSEPRRTPKPAYFKLKFMRLYAKNIKFILRSKKKTRVQTTESSGIGFLYDYRFADHLLEHQEEFLEIPKEMKDGSKTNEWYQLLFKDNQIRIENFRLFIREFFRNDINKLMKRFGFKCCGSQVHAHECFLKWRELRDWTFKKITNKEI